MGRLMIKLFAVHWLSWFLGSQLVNCNNEAFDVLGKALITRMMRNDEMEFALEMIKIKIDGFLNKANLSVPCSQFRRLFSAELEKGSFWTYNLLDSQAKIPTGLFMGKMRFIGSYDQCLQLNVDLRPYKSKYSGLPDTMTTRYCHLRIPLQKLMNNVPTEILKLKQLPQFKQLQTSELTNLRSLISDSNADLMDPDIHICLPSTCTNDDISSIISTLKGAIQIGKTIPTEINNCDDGSSPPWDDYEIIILGFLLLIVWIVLFGSIMDWYHSKYKMKPKFKLISLTINFSVIKNGSSLLNTKESANSISCLHGLKAISMFFIFLGHYGLALMASFAVDTMELDSRAKEFWTQIVVNSSAWVDTFFVISGLLVSYHILDKAGSYSARFKGKSRREQIKMAFDYLLNAYIYRYLRLAVPMIIVLLLSIIWKRFGSGPNWYLWSQEITDTCSRDWWKLLLFVNNFFSQNMVGFECLGPVWYIANDFQFYLLAPFISLLILTRQRWLSWTILILTTIGSMIITGLIIEEKDLTPTIVWHPKMVNGYYTHVYIKPWCRIGAYCIGLGLGDILILTKRNLKINKTLNISLWILSIAVLLAILLMPYRFNSYDFDKMEAIIYGSLHRPVWAMAISWIIFSITTGNAPVVDKILSWSFLVILSRLTYGAYLTQYIVYSNLILANRVYLDATTSLGLALFSGNYILGYASAVILALMVEYPTKNFLEEWSRSRMGVSSTAIKVNQANGYAFTGDVKLTAVNKSSESEMVNKQGEKQLDC
ncbi:nose resistant to fluoxetine protein 6-like [Panonychus citri]|uniref:nose resistant to fluoxetine protein 6-like n=1 Tax=Panonychus citri TaxID=50023 RepID=UPI002308151F|nr:nose resistant to fluoxetine protein 6-like [Panonychus citri]